MNKGVILLVTGKRAEELVKKYSAQSEVDTRVRVLPIEIASFMDMDHILSGLKKKDLKESSMILVPGQAGFDLSSAEEEVGVPIFKGPNHAADIPMVLNNLNDLELSKELSASKLLVEKAAELAKKRVHQIKGEAIESAGEDSNFRLGRNIGSIMVGKDFPPRIVGEIVNAPNLTAEELIDRTSRYLKEGADIIDIGMKAEKSDPEKIRETIRLLRENFNVPLSIDTTDESEIKAALEEGIDMIVSIDGSTIEEFGGLDIPAVIIPRNQDTNYFPEDQKEKLDYLLKLLKRAKKLEYERPIADPLLRPVGNDFADSFATFSKLRNKDSEIPIFMGIGNVIELFDADSVGMSALLMGAASELNINFVLCVEASDKTRRNISEVACARDMMMLAQYRDTEPKDLGIDLLRYKEKRRKFDPYDESIEKNLDIIEASPIETTYEDFKEYFRIFLGEKEIIAVFYSVNGADIIIKGGTSEGIYGEILKKGLIKNPSHAAYIGRELKKAEIALKTDRSYVQEGEVFSSIDKEDK